MHVSFRRWRRALLAVVLLAQAVVLAAGQQAANAAVTQLPFKITNNSGRGDATYVYVVARSAGRQGYVDASGTWRAYSFPSSIPNGPVPAPDIAIPGPGNGATTTITLPPSLSGGRVYVSMGAKLRFFLTTNGLVEPAPWVDSDPNAGILYDWTEFARDSNGGTGIFINSTTVDMFSIPMTVSVTDSSGNTQTQGIPGNRTGVLNAIAGLGSPWSGLTTTRASDGLPLRVLAPVHAIAKGLFPSTYLDSYVNGVWSYYATHPLTVQTSLGTFTGTTSGTNWTFRNASGAVIGTLTRPVTSDVFACSGGMQPQNQPDQAAILAVGARVCAALNRATLSTAGRVMYDTQPTTDATKFYGQSASNLFSKTMHANSLNGLAYGFSYDDVGGFAPTIDQPNPSSAAMTIGSFGTGGGTGGPGGTVAGQPITGPGGKCVDVAGDDTGGNGAPVQLWDCQSYAVDQHYTMVGNTLRTFNGGKCLDVVDNGTANGSKVQIWDCSGGGNQQWVLQSDGSIRNTGSGRCLDSPSGATGNGTRLQIYDCNGSAAQRWSFAGGANIAGPGGKCVDVAGDDTGGNNTAVQLWDCQSYAKDQYWTWSGQTLRTLGRCLDVQSGGTANGTPLQLYDCNTTGAQNWVQLADGSIRNPQSGRCIDAPGGATGNGTRLQIYDCNGSAAQRFAVQ
ncbi:beta-1,3-glucanase family protein [Microbispora sp. KK1-11]|uniref:beta-1,3-glucanase family protein n=1 Tax=Microbispora sp. KK1-11 TaxID=2053005 RepID=UPI00115A08FB|nr:beta-1,3-glucanase family protein [Microbispora sp. KK1-11]TQS25008.1 glucan endo-1,3-beta-D-glucosidase [Microbispora sp. KK1-11]